MTFDLTCEKTDANAETDDKDNCPSVSQETQQWRVVKEVCLGPTGTSSNWMSTKRDKDDSPVNGRHS